MDINNSFDASIRFESLISSLRYLQVQDGSQNITDDIVSIFRRWLSQPLLVSDSDLSKILRFKESHKNSPPLTSGYVCYFRSWPLPAWQFKAIIEDISSQGYPEGDLQGWRDALQSIFDDQSVITLRYVGVTCAPNNPWRRHFCKPPRPNSLLGSFLTTIRRLFPEHAESGRIFSITSRGMSGMSMGNEGSSRLYRKAFQRLSDLSERAWIGFFGFRTLLNRQRGGKSAAINLNLADECIFLKCNSALLRNVGKCQLTKSSQIISHVNRLLKDWWDGTRGSI